MSRWIRERTQIESRLAAVRVGKDVSQQKVADGAGISLNTYRRIERLETTNPPIRYLTNIALVLGVQLEQICEPEWLEWTVFDERMPVPPRS